MSYHPAFNGSPIDPDGFSSPYEDRPRLPRPENRHRSRHFSPSARRSGEDILRELKAGLSRPGADMFFNDCFLTPEAVFTKADEGDDPSLRGRHPHHQGFRVPSWMSEDQDMKDLAARMSHTPHFATMGRRGGTGGPWRERRHSGGSAMSGTSEDDSYDPAGATDRSSQCSGGSCELPGVPHEIPIRFEAPPPPSQQQAPPAQPQEAEEGAGNKPVRTTSAVDATEHGNNDSSSSSRASRCASAPPEMAEQQQQQQQQQQMESPQPQQQQQQPQRFVSKISITPQAPSSPQFSPLPAKFNTVPRPFVSGDPQQQQYQPQPQQYQPQQQQQQYQPQQQQQQYQPQQQQYQPQQPQPQQYQPQQQQQYPPQQQQQYPPQPPLGFFPPPDPQWQFPQQQYPPQQQQQQAQQEAQGQRGGQRPSVVRNIPIFVEGRDEPQEQDSKPSPSWTQPRPQPPAQPQPQPRPQPQPQPTPRQKRQQAHQPTPPPQQPIPHPVPMPMPEPHQAAPTQTPAQPQPHVQEEAAPQHAPTPPPAQPAQPAKDPRLVQIERVRGTVAELTERVNTFCGTKRDRDFLFLDEMLTRALLQLDNVDPEGCDEVRQTRRRVIKDINTAISNLESRAKDPPTPTPAPASPQPAPTAQEPQPSPGPQQDAPTPSQQEPAAENLPKEQTEEKMEVDRQQEATGKSGELAEGSADPPPPQPEVSSS